MADREHDPRFGIITPPTNVTHADLLRVWTEADQVPGIDDAWLFDHLMPIGGDLDGPAFEGWTMLSALAAATSRLRLGLLVTSNRIRPPALLAKIAATVDHVSGGRLEFGIGVGSRPDVPMARREYESHGLHFAAHTDAVAAFDEACTVIRRIWTSDSAFDFDGEHVRLTGAWGNPKPVQRPYPPIVIGGRAKATLRLVAKHADEWNYPGHDLADARERAAMLDRYCTEIDRDPATIVRSLVLPVGYDSPAEAHDTAGAALEAGFSHLVLAPPAPWPDGVAQWLADEIVAGHRPALTPGHAR
ncbi:LLM class flavin-dependent oxidoreductase [Pseudonocardia nematodicida]|uniref:LLM class flavin-dependent oxidoreductase n=1 Tax=Pseudonocardia nematodicida TaxID=1206997 RepID=A0ABV1KH59_9PSEU